MSRIFDLSRPVRVHIVGVGGAGMSAIASVLGAMGHTVTGSDLKPSSSLDRLRAEGMTVTVGHDAALVWGAELVTVSSAVPPSNPEVQAALSAGVPVLSRAEALAAICACRRTLAVAGTHGKTTTTSLLSLVLMEAGMRPSFLIGGDVHSIGTNAMWDSGEWLVVEADESDGTFLELRPEVAVVNNVEPDHLDHYGTFESLVDAFGRFCASAEIVVAGADDPVAQRLGREHGALLVGSSPAATYRVAALDAGPSRVAFELWHEGSSLGRIDLPVLGANIAQNAAVATTAALAVGAPFDAAARALARFTGVARRYERRGEADGVRFVDDYAHLPTEVRAVLRAARQEPGRIVAVFQPHRYTRTAALGTQFGEAFGDADVVVVTDVFAAGEAPVPGVTGKVVADAVRRGRPDAPVHYAPTRPELVALLQGLLEPGDLCLTLGAGDLTSLPDELLGATK
ncbi:MAG: UDP-N-acetylmuramate--L-alanine ligase [Acidimicrobiales bacterium]